MTYEMALFALTMLSTAVAVAACVACVRQAHRVGQAHAAIHAVNRDLVELDKTVALLGRHHRSLRGHVYGKKGGRPPNDDPFDDDDDDDEEGLPFRRLQAFKPAG